jgi:phosphatidate cytidylyltransferase
MDRYLLPYLLLMAHFISGAFWISRITRRFGPDETRAQWTKYGIYLLIVNTLWSCLIWFETIFPICGWILFLVATAEWWLAVHKLRKWGWMMILFLLTGAGFMGFVHMERNILLYTYFVVVLFDGSCQVSGQLVGKRPLLPRISPGKTIEGLAIGAILTMVTTMLTRNSFSFEWSGLILATCLVMGGAFLGDMLASAVKRKAKITTFGNAIPGHGGVIDRFDSLMMAGSIIYLLSAVLDWTG